MRRPVDLTIAYRLLNPGPVVLVSSLYQGRAAITPIAWHMPISDDPPIVALEIWKDHAIHKAILETKDFVINIPASDMAKTVVQLGKVSSASVDKFAAHNLTKEPSATIASPRLARALAVIECTLHPDKHVLEEYSVILGDIVYAEADDSAFTDRWLPEKGGNMFMHHLGGNVFSASRTLVT